MFLTILFDTVNCVLPILLHTSCLFCPSVASCAGFLGDLSGWLWSYHVNSDHGLRKYLDMKGKKKKKQHKTEITINHVFTTHSTYFSLCFYFCADCFSEEALQVLTQTRQHSRKVIYNSKSVLNMLLFSNYLEISNVTNSL